MKTAYRKASQAKRQWKADPMAMFKCINKIEPFNASELMQLELPIRISFESLKSGQGTERDFYDLAAAINTTMVRSESIDPLCTKTAIDARDALMRCWNRFERIGKLGFDGPGLAAVEAGIELHEQLIKLSTPLQMMQALQEVVQRGKNGQVAA